jgi:hypothetical protein
VGKGRGSAEIEQLHAGGSDVTDPTNSPTRTALEPDWQPLTATSRPLPDHSRDERGPTVKRTAKEGASMHHRARTLALAATVALAAAALLGGVAPAGAVPAGTSCPPISAPQLHAILRLPNSLQTRNTVDTSGGADTYLCNGVAWSGPAPQSFQAGLQRAKSGQAAGFGIEAWQPDGHDCCWLEERFPRLRSRFLEGWLDFPGLLTSRSWPTKRIEPEGFGHAAVGIVTKVGSGPTKGLVAAIGCWWDSGAYTAACLFVEEAAGKPVVKHLNALAQIAVPKVL